MRNRQLSGIMDKVQEIRAAFEEVGLSVEEIYQIEENEILVCISWGDWKHEHLACEQIMKKLGYIQVQEVITEDNGSDCYSSEHTFIKI